MSFLKLPSIEVGHAGPGPPSPSGTKTFSVSPRRGSRTSPAVPEDDESGEVGDIGEMGREGGEPWATAINLQKHERRRHSWMDGGAHQLHLSHLTKFCSLLHSSRSNSNSIKR